MLLDPESLKALRKKHIERIDGGNAEGDQEGTTDEHIKNSIAFGMDTDFWRSPEYLEYCKEKAPEIYSPDPAQVAKDVAPFLEKTNDEIALFAFESCAETIEKGDIYDGISRTTKIVASEFVLDIPEDMQIKLGFLADMDSPPDGITTETDAFFYKEDNTVYLTKPLEFYGENPIDTIALIAHEVFHGYQYYISEKQKDHPKSDIYTENWGHYIPMSTDIEAYMHQLVEAEAYIFQIGLRNQLINSKQGVVA